MCSTSAAVSCGLLCDVNQLSSLGLSSRVCLPPTTTWECPSQAVIPVDCCTPTPASASATTTCCPSHTHTPPCRGTACPLSGPPALEMQVCIYEQNSSIPNIWLVDVWTCVFCVCRTDGFGAAEHCGLQCGYDCNLFIFFQPLDQTLAEGLWPVQHVIIQHLTSILWGEEKPTLQLSWRKFGLQATINSRGH